MGEFILLYEVVQRSDDPEGVLMQFLQSTYEAAANTANWDRKDLECDLSRFEEPGKCWNEINMTKVIFYRKFYKYLWCDEGYCIHISSVFWLADRTAIYKYVCVSKSL